MNFASIVALALILLSPAGERDFHVGSRGEAVQIHAQLSRHYDGEPLRFTDEDGRKTCFDETGELTVRCVDRFYGASPLPESLPIPCRVSITILSFFPSLQ